MKRILLFFVAIFSMFQFASAAEAGDNLIISTKDGQQVTYLLSTRPVVTFEGTDLVLKTTEVTVKYPLADIEDMTFDLASGIQPVKMDQNISFTIDANHIAANGLKNGEVLQVFSLDGKVLVNATASEDGQLSVSTEALPHGVYVVKAGKKSYKIMK